MKHGLLALLALLLGANAAEAEIVRYPIPNSTFPIAQAVAGVRRSRDHLCQRPGATGRQQGGRPQTPQAYGDVKTQTVGVLTKIKQILEGQGSAWAT